MELISVKQNRDVDSDLEIASPNDEYPWGLSLHLETEIIDKLKAGELNSGDTVRIEAVAFVSQKTVSSRADDEGSPEHKNMNIQITDMALTPITRDLAEKLYG